MAGRKVVDITGNRYGKLVVLKLCVVGAGAGTKWLCVCDCGKQLILPGVYLKVGDTKSCGCLRIETSRELMRDLSLTHGYTVGGVIPPEYKTWVDMRDRCRRKKHPMWEHYGGRGITVCKRWASFKNFIEDMGERPSPSHTLDRINNDSGYRPSNCRWATKSEQSSNQRKRGSTK